MRLEDFVNYIITRLKEKFPEIDFSPGSALYDFLCVPLAFLYDKFASEIDKKVEEYTLSYYEKSDKISEIVDILASNFLQKRCLGAKAIGTLYLYFETRTRVYISKEATFSTLDNKIFLPIADYQFTPIDFVIENNLYRLTIDIIANDFGDEYNVGKDMIVKCLSGVSPAPVKVRNPEPTRGGLKRETDKEFLERIKREYFFPAVITTKKSLEKFLATELGISDACIIDANDELMIRDNYTELISYPIEIEKNFLGKGINVLLNENRAFKIRRYSSFYVDKILAESYHGFVREDNRNLLKDETKNFIQLGIKANDFLCVNNNYFLIIEVNENSLKVSTSLPIGDNLYYLVVRFKEEFFTLPTIDELEIEDFEFTIDEYNKIAKSDNYILEIKPGPLLTHPLSEEEFRQKFILSECFYPPGKPPFSFIFSFQEGKIILGKKLKKEEEDDLRDRARKKMEE